MFFEHGNKSSKFQRQRMRHRFGRIKERLLKRRWAFRFKLRMHHRVIFRRSREMEGRALKGYLKGDINKQQLMGVYRTSVIVAMFDSNLADKPRIVHHERSLHG